jgi:predicted PurR-regulated permease PerM
MADMDALLAHYIRALVALSLAAFTAYSIFFALVGMPYGILLAAFAALLEIVPMLGPAVAGITVALVALISGTHLLTVIVFVIAFRMLQDYILSPHLMGRGVQLHPVLVLFGVFAGAEVAGIPGTFLSVPALALARVLYLRLRKARPPCIWAQQPPQRRSRQVRIRTRAARWSKDETPSSKRLGGLAWGGPFGPR